MDQKPRWTCRKSLRSVCEVSIVFSRKFPFWIIGSEVSSLRLLQVQRTFDSCRATFISRKEFEYYLRDKGGIHRVSRKNGESTPTVCLSSKSNTKLKDRQFCSSFNDALPDHVTMPACTATKTFACGHFLAMYVQEKHQDLRTSVSSRSDKVSIIAIIEILCLRTKLSQ